MAREWYSRPINSGYTVVDGTTTGNYNNGVPNTYVKTWMEYKVLQDSTDIANNRSRIDVKLYSQVIDGGSSTGMSNTFTANNYGYVGYDNANQQYLNTTYDFNGFALNKFADATLTIPHNADGTKTITLQGAFQTLSGTWAITGGSASASVTLPTIARGTELVSVANPYYGHNSYFTLSRKASNLREQVTMTSGSTTLTIKQTSTSDVNFYYELARSYTPNTTKPSASTWTISVKTYNGSTLVETKTYSQVFRIADGDEGSYLPLFTLSDITVQGYNDVVSSFGTNMVAGYSKMNVITAKSAIQLKYGATVASRVVTFQDGKTVSGIDDTNHISNKIMTAGNYSWRYVVVDSRGFSYEASGSAYVYGYSAPSIDVTECYRGDSSGNASPSGTYVWAKATASYTSVAGNSITSFKGQVTGFSAVNLTDGTRTQLTNSASVTNVYTVTFTATDKTGTTATITRSIPSEDIPINIREGGKGLGLGAYCQGEGLLNIGYELDGAFKSKGGRYVATCNLLDQTIIERGALDGSTGVMVDWYARIRSGFTPIKPNTTYTISWSGNAIPSMFYYSSAKAYVTCELTSNEVTSYTFTTPSGVGFVKFTWGKSGNAYITPSDISYVQLEKGSQASSFAPYTMDGVEVAEKLRICEPLVAYGTEIPANENLNTVTYVNVGLYYRADNATVATFSNCPTTVGFSMLVRNVNKTDVNSSAKTWQYLTREITDINGNQFIQTAFCGSTVGAWVFGEWKQIIVGRKTGTLTANVGSFDEAYCRQSGDTVDIHGWLVGLSTSDSSHANAITVSGVSLPSVPIRFVFTCWLNNGIASYAGYGVLDTYGNITFVKPVANSNKVSFTITYVV